MQRLLQHILKILNEGLDIVEANQSVKMMSYVCFLSHSFKNGNPMYPGIVILKNQVIQNVVPVQPTSFFGHIVSLNEDLTDCSNLRSICLVKSRWRLSSGRLFTSNTSNFTFHICKCVSVFYLIMKQSLYMHYVVPSYQVASYYYYHHCHYCAVKYNRIYFNFTSLLKRNVYTQVCYMCSNPLFTTVILNCSSITK